jgi:hypothetical protein
LWTAICQALGRADDHTITRDEYLAYMNTRTISET